MDIHGETNYHWYHQQESNHKKSQVHQQLRCILAQKIPKSYLKLFCKFIGLRSSLKQTPGGPLSTFLVFVSPRSLTRGIFSGRVCRLLRAKHSEYDRGNNC